MGEAGPKRMFGVTMVVTAAVLALLGPSIHEPRSYELYAHEGAAVLTGLIGIWLASSKLTLREQLANFFDRVDADPFQQGLRMENDPRAGDGRSGD